MLVDMLIVLSNVVTRESKLDKFTTTSRKALQCVERERYGGPLGREAGVRTPEICLETHPNLSRRPHNGERIATHVQIANCWPTI